MLGYRLSQRGRYREQDADGGPGQDSHLQALSRDARFQEFVLRSTLRLLQAAAAGALPAPLSGVPRMITLLHSDASPNVTIYFLISNFNACVVMLMSLVADAWRTRNDTGH